MEFENLLAGQEALAKQMGGVSLKGEEEALYANKGRRNSKQHAVKGSKKNEGEVGSHQGEGSFRAGGRSRNYGNGQRFGGRYYNCKKKGHMAKDF